jgi:hypothetical protein
MSKRFIDTETFDDSWFMELSKDGKLFWLYCITKCDHAGIIKINQKLCKFQTGIVNIQTVIEELGNRLVTLNEDLYFIPNFIKYQYPNFPQSNVRQQSSAISILCKYGLFDTETNSLLTLNKEYTNSSLTLNKELANSYDNDNDNVIDTDIRSEKNNTWRTDFLIYQKECNAGYNKCWNDDEWWKKTEELYPSYNLERTIKKSHAYWSSEEGWRKKKASKTKDIDWKATIIKSLDISRSYYTREEEEERKRNG